MWEKYGDKEREKGNSKMEGKSPLGGGKRAQKFLKNVFLKILKEKNVLQILTW